MTAAPSLVEPQVEVGEVVDGGPGDELEPVVLATVELAGKRFTVRQQGVSLLALMKFATIAKAGKTSDDMEGLSALYKLLRSCIADDEWDAFEDHANDVGADGEALMHVVTDAVTAAAARPTQQPSHSQDGRSPTAASSAAGSSSPGSSIRQGDPRVQTDLERRGRPDLGLVVKRAREASTTS